MFIQADEWFEYWINFSNEWFINIGLSEDKLRKRVILMMKNRIMQKQH